MRDDRERLLDVLVHLYFGIDEEAVWSVVQKDLSDLKRKVERIVGPD